MATITGEIHIERPVDVVFDFVADERNEPKYNPRISRAEKLTDGPIGPGSRFLATVTSGGRPIDMQIEFTAYERPTRLVSHASMASAEARGMLTFEPEPAGTRMCWTWEVEPKGPVRLLAPLVARVGAHQEQAIWTGLKRYLEAAGREEVPTH